MLNFVRVAGLVGVLAATLATIAPTISASAAADPPAERQVVTTELGPNASAITFRVSEPDGWRVVTTVDIVFGQDTDAERHAVARFAAVLLPRPSQHISVPVAIGVRQQVLRVRRIGDRIEAAPVAGLST
jgi:hypothetical protein